MSEKKRGSLRAPISTPQPVNRRARLGKHDVEYVLCRVLPDTALVLRDVLREAARLWSAHLGAERDAAIRATPEGEAFFVGRVRLEPVPPEREMVAVWLPFPVDFDARVRPQLVDFIEPQVVSDAAPEPPEGWADDA
ncbi:MAG: hypothetical protein PVJ51_14250 [Acidobacteriota bacterium]|jgi:hypothetical protein